MMRLTGQLAGRACHFCGEREGIRVLKVSGDGKERTAVVACALCLAGSIDAAMGWKIRMNVSQGLIARRIGQEIQAGRPKRRRSA